MVSTPMKAVSYAPCTPSSARRNLFAAAAASPAPLTPRANLTHNLSKLRIGATPAKNLDVVAADYAGIATPKLPAKKTHRADRFIPSRPASVAGSKMEIGADSSAAIAEACGLSLNQRILAFAPEAPAARKPVDLRSIYAPSASSKKVNAVPAALRRKISTAPEKVLDAPGLVDDYYLNLMDWSAANTLAIALERTVYIWNASSGDVSELCEVAEHTFVTSVKWSTDGSHLSIGLDSGDIEIWDPTSTKQKPLRTMRGHESRVGVMSWNSGLLTSGTRSGALWNHDVRIREHKTASLEAHVAEVCGLEWRADGAFLASGGNDNLVAIWDARNTREAKFERRQHKAAVKALAWCPWQSTLLATGGGTADKQIHFWNANTGARVQSVDAGSQVTGLKFSSTYRELISTHGFPDNNLTVWSYSSSTATCARTIDIPAHESRVLGLGLSPDGTTVATVAADENLKFWKVWEKVKGKGSSSGSSARSVEKKMEAVAGIR